MRTWHAFMLGCLIVLCPCKSSGAPRVGASTAAVSANGVNAALKVTTDWGSGYCADVSLQNASAAAVTSWTVVVDLNQGALSQLWNGSFTQSGTQITVKPVGAWNSTLAPGASLSAFGFCGNRAGTNYQPTLVSVAVDGGSGGDPSGAAFTIAASPASVTVSQGASATSAISLARTGGFASSVALTVSGLPSGVTAGLDPASTAGDSSTLTLTASGTAATGAGSVTVTATGGGVTRTVPISLTVNAAATTADFALSASPASVSIAQGASATSAISLTRTGGFASSVALTASGLPSGVTASFDPASTAGDSSTLTLTATSAAVTGAGSVTVTAAGGGLTRTASISLTVGSSQAPTARVENPFGGARYYVNPQWAAQVRDAATRAPSDLSAAVTRVASQPSAFWLDRIAAIDGSAASLGLPGHLDEAVKQQASAGGGPMLVAMIVYDLPDRDCAAFASNGELHTSENGLARYKAEYIDRIVQVIQSKPEYQQLRIAAIVEPDSLPNIVTNTGLYASCAAAEATYRAGVAYAVKQLATLSNAYIYLDIAHSAWLGWEHPDRAATVYNEVLSAAGGGNLVRGFATNVANYSALQESFNPYDNQSQYNDLIVNFYEWNRMIDEVTYVNAMRSRFPNHHFLVDTGRNGWQPRAAGLPIENRIHRGNWCNVKGAGIGERPRAEPMAGVDAYYWLKPPGESDGTSDSTQTTPDAEGKRYDPMCGADPVERPYAPGKLIATDALQGAPPAGHWFEEQFFMLVKNATPAL
jgi:cellulose 1,4-beta-cellobiosidase